MATTRKNQTFWQRHGLSLVLLAILLIQLILYWFTGLAEWKGDQELHGVVNPAIWPDYVIHYNSEVWVSVLADSYGAILLVILTKKLQEQGSAESKK